MNTWNYVQNGQPCGPVETSALQALLRDGTLAADTLVWQAGMTNWVPASTVPEFAPATPPGSTMPPIPTENLPPMPGNRLRISTSLEYGPTPGANATPPASASPDSDAADIEKNKVFAVLAYIGLLFLVPLLAAPHSKFARYHTNQGVVLFISILALYFTSFILYFVCLLLIPFVSLSLFKGHNPLPSLSIIALVPLVMMAGGISALVMVIIGIINAANGKTKPLPLIGHFRLIK